MKGALSPQKAAARMVERLLSDATGIGRTVNDTHDFFAHAIDAVVRHQSPEALKAEKALADENGIPDEVVGIQSAYAQAGFWLGYHVAQQLASVDSSITDAGLARRAELLPLIAAAGQSDKKFTDALLLAADRRGLFGGGAR